MDVPYLPYLGVRDRNWETYLLTVYVVLGKKRKLFRILICKVAALNAPSETL